MIYGDELGWSSIVKMLYQSVLMRELCDTYNIKAFALRSRILRSNQDYSNWSLIRRFCSQELIGIDVSDLYSQYYMASVLRTSDTLKH
jgi:hypothetical protein